jgi:phospholipid/cholesterol/gamma-HCH transport system substrate-binding protein
MAQQRSVEIRVGLFVLICLAVVAGMILKFGKYERFAAKTYEITVVFPNVGGIPKDANVMYGGIGVGKVREINLDQTGKLRVNVKLAIYEGVKIRKDAKFVINTSGLLGDRYVDVIPQGGTAEPIKPGETVEGSASVDLSEAIRGVVDVLQQTAGTIARVDKVIKRIDETVLSTQSLAHISIAMANVEATTSNAVEFTGSLRSLVADSRDQVESAVTSFSDASENLSIASKRVDDLISTNRDDIHLAAKNLAESTQRLNTILTRLEKGEGTAGKLLVDPTLHDEIVRLVQNWREYGLLYKEGPKRESKRTENTGRGVTPVPGRPAKITGDGLIFGTDSTKPSP